jgi:hypothetical protein
LAFFINKLRKITRHDLQRQLVLAYILLFIALASEAAFAQAWKNGRSLLMRNDFKNAKVQLNAALKNSKTRTELAETYKYLGVAHFMAGEKRAAQQAFGLAKSNNPRVRLSPNEVLDESVLPLFSQAKPIRISSNRAKTRTSQPATTSRTSAANNRSSAPAISRQKSKRTLLKVNSNVPNAAISIDGINYGVSGQEIEVTPGTVILEVAAKGFKSKAIKVKLQPRTSSLVNVNLDRIIVAPKPRPVPKNTPVANTKIPLPGQPKKVVGNPSKKSNDLFGEDPMMDLPYAGTPIPQQAPQQIIPPPPPAQPVMPQPGYAPPPPGYAAPPPYAPSPYPVYPQYAPMQPYGAPMYPVAPYGGYMPPPNPYAYPPPTPPPPAYAPSGPVVDPYGGYLGPPPEASLGTPAPEPLLDGPAPSGGGMPPPPILPGEGKPKVSRTRVARDKCGMIRLLPFGAGQFCNGSTLKGLFFLGAQATSLYFYRVNSVALASSKSKLNAYLADRASEREDTTEDLEEFDQMTLDREKSGNLAIDKANQNAQYSMVSFVGLWGLGVLDAYINKPSDKPKKKRRKPRIMYSFDLDADTAPLGTWAINMPKSELISFNESTAYKLGYTPIRDKTTNKLLHGLTLNVTLEL